MPELNGQTLVVLGGSAGIGLATARQAPAEGADVIQLDARRAELQATLPIGRVVQPEDVGALAVHLMANTAVTGRPATSSGQQLVS